MIFQMGERVKLKDYQKHSDYRSHAEQTAIITKPAQGGSFDWHIKWKDKSTSCVCTDNLVAAEYSDSLLGAIEEAIDIMKGSDV